MDLFNVTTRRKDTIDDQNALHQAILSGSHAFSQGSSVTVKSPNGQMGTIPAENVAEAIRAGYQVETNSQRAVREYVDDNQGITGALKVGLGQFADEALIGLPELIYNKTADPLEVAKKEALKKEHGLANAFGGISGFGASLFLGSPLWKAGSKAGEKVAGHIAEKLAVEAGEQVGKRTLSNAAKGIAAKIGGAATEGAIVSAPYAITEAALGDPEAAAETMLAGVGIGSLFGAGAGLGKEFLGLGKKVSSETALLVGESDLNARKIARRAAKVITNVDEDDILYYMKNSDKVNTAPTVEALKDEIDRAVKERADNVLLTREAYKNADSELKQAYANARRDLSQTRAPQELADDIVRSLEAEKAVLGEMSQRADDILADSAGFLPKKKIIRMIDQVQENVTPFTIGEKATQTSAKLNTLRNRIDEQFPSNLEMTEVREIIRQVRDDINYNQLAGEFNDRANKARKAFTKSVSDAVKKQVPEYADQMARMEKRAKALEKMSKSFGERERAAGMLNRMLKPGGEVKRELLEEFSNLTGDDFATRFAELAKAKDQLERSARQDISRELVPNLFNKREELGVQLASAERTLDKISRLGPTNTQNAIRNMGFKTPNIATRKALEDLSEMTGVNYLEQIKDRNILDAFDKASTQGSRKVNAGALLASTLLSGAAGFTVGGPIGLAAGAAAGATLDVYGGQILKSFMDRAPNMAGLLFVEKAMKKTADRIDTIPGIIDRMAKGPRGVKKSTIAIDALFRLTNPEAKPTRKERQNPGEQLEKIGDKIRSWLADPSLFENMIGKFTTPLAEGGAPNISQGLTIGAQKALSYLLAEMPKPPAPSSPFAPKISWNPSDFELNKFAQILQVAEDPLVVLDELEAGTLTSNHMDALKAMYPSVYQAIQAKVIDTATTNPEPMPYAERVKLSILTDLPLDESMNDEQLLKLQKPFMAQENEQPDLEDESFSPSQDVRLAKANLTTMQSAVMQ